MAKMSNKVEIVLSKAEVERIEEALWETYSRKRKMATEIWTTNRSQYWSAYNESEKFYRLFWQFRMMLQQWPF